MSGGRISFDLWADSYAERVGHMRRSAVRDLFAAASRSDIISLSGGMPDISNLPLGKVKQVAARCIAEEGIAALQYGDSRGRVQTREVFCELMAQTGVRVKPDDMIITAGAQQALELLARIFVNPGDPIICEGPTYLGALQAFSAHQPEFHCIEMDDDGMRMDLLEAEIEDIARAGKPRPKFIYTIPNFQNPTGVTMTPERRRKLLEIANRHGIPVIEDDPYGRLRYDGGHVRPMRALDDQVIYLGTVSKIFAPGMRVGWTIAPRPILDKMVLAKQGSELCGSTFNQVMCEHYFRDTDWQRALQKVNKVYHRRRDAMLAALDETLPAGVRWTHPEGGFFIWITLPPFLDTDQLLPRALESGVTFVPGRGCYPDGRGGNSMRTAFCFEEPERLCEAVSRLGACIEDRMALCQAFIDAGALKVE